MTSSSPKRQGITICKLNFFTGRSPSPSNHVSDSAQYASITLLEVEKESIQTQIIAQHLQTKVVGAEI